MGKRINCCSESHSVGNKNAVIKCWGFFLPGPDNMAIGTGFFISEILSWDTDMDLPFGKQKEGKGIGKGFLGFVLTPVFLLLKAFG